MVGMNKNIVLLPRSAQNLTKKKIDRSKRCEHINSKKKKKTKKNKSKKVTYLLPV